MFRSLNSRLLLSYIAVVLVCLAVVGLGLFLFVQTSPLWTRVNSLTLEAAARATMPVIARAGRPDEIPPEQFHALLAQAATEQDVRILLLDNTGRIDFDSAGQWEGSQITQIARSRRSRPLQGFFAAPDGQRWIFFGEAVPAAGGGQQVIAFVSPPVRLLLLAWFAENLLPPLLQAGLVALVVSALLAWLVTRSVARPLNRVATAARGLARGDLGQRAPVSGPQEVQDVARAFNHMAERVATSQQVQRDFVANVSHELKTPLTSVQGFSQAILDGTADNAAAVERAARVIHEEAERMHHMVEELLHLARFDAGQLQLERKPVDLTSLLERCAERLTPQARASGSTILTSIQEGLVATGDADWLAQVFGNLVDNAIRHCRDGDIEISARRTADWIEATVTDSGEGISPEELGRIFERFYQADKARRHGGGAGLGLSIAREVVQLHGGDVTVESVVGLGSRFTVRLPAREGSRAKTQVGRREA
jgi:two-component system OmpR family sensor kinase